MLRALAATIALAALLAATAYAGLTLDEANALTEQLWSDYAARYTEETADELTAEAIEVGDTALRFRTVQFTDGVGTPCEAPCEAEDGEAHPLFISMHGGGGTTAEINDQQWDNQVKLAGIYKPEDGIYLAPRAPTDTWDCWHSAAVDPLLERLIRAFIATGTVDPDRVYLMGYSAGGDGVYALAPRMADRFAAAAMMAGHPNGISMAGIRNLPFSIQVGELDTAYDRADVAKQYGEMLDALQKADPDGYVHFTKIHAGKGHSMDNEDVIAVPWMESYSRDMVPDRIVWRQQGVIHNRFYWLAVPQGEAEMGDKIIAERDRQTITVSGPSGRTLLVRLNDTMLDLDQDVTILSSDGETLHEGPVERQGSVITTTIEEFGDPAAVFTAQIEVTLP